MISVIGWIAGRTGLGSLLSTIIVYALIVALGGGSLWAWGAHKYHSGYAAGASHEQRAWEDQRKRDLAKQAARVASDQEKIDQIERDNLALQAQLADTQTALEEAIHADGTDPKPVMPKSISKSLNRVGR